MRILHVIPSFVPAWRYGGPIRVVFDLCRELVRQGHAASVFTTNVDGPLCLPVPLGRPVWMDGVEVWYFPVQRPRFYTFSIPLALALRDQVRRFDVVNVHSVLHWPLIPSAFFCRRNSVPYIVRPCGMLTTTDYRRGYEKGLKSRGVYLKKRIYSKLLEKKNLDKAAAIHFTTEEEMEASQWLGIKAPAFVAPLGVDLNSIWGTNSQGGLQRFSPRADGRKIILFLSRIDPKKGMEILIPSMERLAAIRNDFIFLVAGSGKASYLHSIKEKIFSAGLKDRTVFIGQVNDDKKWSVFKNADVFVLPSFQENFGLAVVEAMACGIPVVISNRVNIWREVQKSGAGIVTECKIECFSRALNKLLEEDHTRVEMGKRGRRVVEEKYSLEMAASKLIKEYRLIIGGDLTYRESSLRK